MTHDLLVFWKSLCLWDFSKFRDIRCPFVSSVFPSLLPLSPSPTRFSIFNKLGPRILPLRIGLWPRCCPHKALQALEGWSWSWEVAWGSSGVTHVKHTDDRGAEGECTLILLTAQSKHSSPPSVWSLVSPPFAPSYPRDHSLSCVKATNHLNSSSSI